MADVLTMAAVIIEIVSMTTACTRRTGTPREAAESAPKVKASSGLILPEGSAFNPVLGSAHPVSPSSLLIVKLRVARHSDLGAT